jgi:uncharacterized membrane protein
MQRQAHEAERLAAETAKAEDEHRARVAAASEQAARLANEERLRREAEEREASKQANRQIWVYGGMAILTFLYFLPSLIGRKKRNFAALFVLNLMGFVAWAGWVIGFFHFVLGFTLGSTGIPQVVSGIIVACGGFLLPLAAVIWIAAIIWSFLTDAKAQTVIQTVVMHAPQQQHPVARPVAVPRPAVKAIEPPPYPPTPPPPPPPA